MTWSHRYMTIYWILNYIVIVIGSDPDTVKLVANSNYTLFCTNLENHSLDWYYYQSDEDNRNMIEPNDHYQISNTGNLEIFNITPDIEGYYYCVKNDLEQITTRILVLGVPDVSADGVNDGSSTNITINIQYLNGGPAQKTVDINFVLLKQNSSNSNILLCEDQDTCDKDSSVISLSRVGWSNFSMAINDSDIKEYEFGVRFSVQSTPKEISKKFSISTIPVSPSTSSSITATSSLPLSPSLTSSSVSTSSIKMTSINTPLSTTTPTSSNETPPTTSDMVPGPTSVAGDKVIVIVISITVVVMVTAIILLMLVAIIVTFFIRRRSKEEKPNGSEAGLTTTTDSSEDKYMKEYRNSKDICIIYETVQATAVINRSLYNESIDLPPQVGTTIVQV